MLRKRWLSVVFVVMMALVVTSCGGSQQSATPAKKDAAPAPAPKAEAPPAAKAQTPAPAPAAAKAPPAAPAPAQPKALKKVKSAVTVMGLSLGVTLLAKNAGFYAEQGYEIELSVASGTPAYASLVNGEIDIYDGGAIPTYSMAAAGNSQVMVVEQTLGGMSMDVVVSKQWAQKQGVTAKDPLEKRLKALKGARMATMSLGGAPDVMTRYLIKKAGFDPTKDVEIVATNNTPAALAAVKNGQLDGYMLSTPNSHVAEAEGWGVVLIPYNDVPEFMGVPHESLQIATKFKEQKRDLVVSFARAHKKSRDMLAKNPAESIKLLTQEFKQIDPKLVEIGVNHLIPAYLNGQGALSEAGFRNHIRLAAEAGQLKSADIEYKEGVHWTNEFIRAAN